MAAIGVRMGGDANMAVIDLEDLPITDSIELLREHMLRAPVPLVLEPHPNSEIVVRSRVADLGELHLLCTKAKGGDVVRNSRLASDDHRASLMISVMDSGTTTVVRGDDGIRLRPGDLALYATDEPYRISFSPGAERLTYQIPFDRLGLPPQLVRAQLATPIRPDAAVSASVSRFLRSTAHSATTPDAVTPDRLEGPALDLIRLLLTRVVADTALGRKAMAQSLAARIEQHVRSRIGDSGLTARSIADAFSISERYVYLILARRGVDLGDMVRARRLERAVRMLADAAAPRTLARIAHDCGFADHAHFSRTFRAHYGMSPSEWRIRHASGTTRKSFTLSTSGALVADPDR